MDKVTKAKSMQVKAFLNRVITHPVELSPAVRGSVNRMLQSVFANQTDDEQNQQVTRYSNGAGFNSLDAGFLSDVAIRAQQYPLSERQARSVAKSLRKYSGQIALQAPHFAQTQS